MRYFEDSDGNGIEPEGDATGTEGQNQPPAGGDD
jgi:hypothetical protein